MLKLEDIKTDAQIRGLQGDAVVRIVQTRPIGEDALTVYYKDGSGHLAEQMLFRADESRLQLAEAGRAWAFDAPGAEFKLGLEAYRISQAALFDPMMAVHTSNVDPYPHQLSAVYEAMLPRQPLRFVLADDPGAGKTIMAGLLIRELLMRADARRILIVAPGGLTEQWQDEMLEKFGVHFEIFSREKQEQCASGNFFSEQNQLICRLDQLARNEDYQQQLGHTEWDIVIVDEAHKMSAHYYGNKINKTKRFQLGELLGSLTRHFLLMTATPHNGKDDDFQVWLSLLDSDRFYGKFREGVHKVDVSDMMRRMVKEDLLKFDGTKLFPPRHAYTANYELSDAEARLYADVTDYVRNEMNRAERLEKKNHRNTVGFALTLLQRRLASSPEAIYQSLKRRHRKMEAKLDEHKLIARGANPRSGVAETLGEYQVTRRFALPEDIDDLDEELTAEEFEHYADQVVDQATASRSIPELEAEIETLRQLEQQALNVVRSGNDRKWEELSELLQKTPEMFKENEHRRKLIVFTEHKDTLNYLVQGIGDLLGNPEAVITIHGGINRDERRKLQERFRNDPDVLVLVATDAAGEGVNLQNANLMVNYDLPWNPNRLEQRFGRIHRIGQTEVCHMWNMVAAETREGAVFRKLFDKLEAEREALGGKVFDILGDAFEGVSLRELLIDAIRNEKTPEEEAVHISNVIDATLDTEHLREIMRRNALVEQHMNLDDLYAVKEEMDKAEARRLQPYFIRAFFAEAFASRGGDMRPRENGRFEIPHVPAAIRERDRVIGESRTPALKKYERICFRKDRIRITGKPMADLVHPGHPLMHATTDLVLSEHRGTLRQGAVLVDRNDAGRVPRLLLMVSHEVRESRAENEGDKPRVVSRRLQFVALDEHGNAHFAGWAPHLDLEPIQAHDRTLIDDLLAAPWLHGDVEAAALEHASRELVPDHYQEAKTRRERQADKTIDAVQKRLVTEINHWTDRYLQLKDDVAAGKQPRMQPENARRRAEDLAERLKQRKHELETSRNVVSTTPVVVGGALVIPQGLLDQRNGKPAPGVDAQARARVERIAMQAVMDAERALGHTVIDVSADKCGWDLTARPPAHDDGSLPPNRHIEVKGRAKGQTTITVSKNEILYGLNQAEQFILAIVIVDGNHAEGPYYVRKPFTREPDFGVASSNYDLAELLDKAQPPEATT